MASEACAHCGRTSHGFACCGSFMADHGGCKIDHFTAPSAAPKPTERQHGPMLTHRAPREIRLNGMVRR